MTTKTAQIFELTTPYDNPYQSNRPRWLFACSAGLLRSPTGAAVGTAMGKNTRSCGTHDYALIPLSVNLILWAQKIFFVNIENYDRAKSIFEITGYWEDIKEKAIVLNIPDEYDAFHPDLIKLFETALAKYA